MFALVHSEPFRFAKSKIWLPEIPRQPTQASRGIGSYDEYPTVQQGSFTNKWPQICGVAYHTLEVELKVIQHYLCSLPSKLYFDIIFVIMIFFWTERDFDFRLSGNFRCLSIAKVSATCASVLSHDWQVSLKSALPSALRCGR